MWCGIVGGMAIDRIVVGVDGSMNSLQAVEFAAEMAAAADAEVVAVHALGLLEHIDGDEVVPAYPNRHEIERRFHSDWTAPLDGTGLRVRRILRDGEASSVVLAVAEEESADLIRSEEHTSELQSLMRLSYDAFCLKKKKQENTQQITHIKQQYK